MSESINRENLPIFLGAYLETNNIEIIEIAKSIGCSTSTINRIIGGKTIATDNFIKQCAILFEISIEKYKKLSDTEKEKISERLGAISGAGLGFASLTATISGLGISGLSAAGITSGLAALGGVIGGGMIAGVAVAAAIPLAIGTAGYGLIKGIKSVLSYKKMVNEDLDLKWEIIIKY